MTEDLSESEEHWIERYIPDHVMPMIERIGWMGQAVFDHTGKEPPFVYTVGLTAKGRSELVVVGLSPQQGHAVLAEVVRMLDDGFVYVFGEPFVGALAKTYPLLPIAVPTTRLAIARKVYGDEVSATQLLWTDTERRFPGEVGYTLTRQTRLDQEE